MNFKEDNGLCAVLVGGKWREKCATYIIISKQSKKEQKVYCKKSGELYSICTTMGPLGITSRQTAVVVHSAIIWVRQMSLFLLQQCI